MTVFFSKIKCSLVSCIYNCNVSTMGQKYADQFRAAHAGGVHQSSHIIFRPAVNAESLTNQEFQHPGMIIGNSNLQSIQTIGFFGYLQIRTLFNQVSRAGNITC